RSRRPARRGGGLGRGAEPAPPARRLPVPPALPPRDAGLLRRAAGPTRSRQPPGRLPPLLGVRSYIPTFSCRGARTRAPRKCRNVRPDPILGEEEAGGAGAGEEGGGEAA